MAPVAGAFINNNSYKFFIHFLKLVPLHSRMPQIYSQLCYEVAFLTFLSRGGGFEKEAAIVIDPNYEYGKPIKLIVI